jgi:hypothetical protein
MRIAKKTESDLADKAVDQTRQISFFETQHLQMQERIREAKSQISTLNPTIVMNKLREEVNMNRYLVSDKYQKDIKTLSSRIDYMNQLSAASDYSEVDLQQINDEIQEIQQYVSKYTSKTLLDNK